MNPQLVVSFINFMLITKLSNKGSRASLVGKIMSSFPDMLSQLIRMGRKQADFSSNSFLSNKKLKVQNIKEKRKRSVKEELGYKTKQSHCIKFVAGHSFHKYSKNMYNPHGSILHIYLSDLCNWMMGMSDSQESRMNPVHVATKKQNAKEKVPL